MGKATIVSDHEIVIHGDLKDAPPTSFRLVRKQDADIPLKIQDVRLVPEHPQQHVLTTIEVLDPNDTYMLTAPNYGLAFDIAPSVVGVVVSVIIGAALINNFVFTRYLGLCVFFGVSRKKDTAIGMGITFTIVGILSGVLSWVLHQYALNPLHLSFLQIIGFIGIVACLVQASDTIIRKINPNLYKKFGIFLMLITTNCIILAVPLLNATKEASFLEALGLSIGAGVGFALALFLMSCARERVEIAHVPKIFRGLPIAFIIAGLFALSFLGFSGLKF